LPLLSNKPPFFQPRQFIFHFLLSLPVDSIIALDLFFSIFTALYGTLFHFRHIHSQTIPRARFHPNPSAEFFHPSCKPPSRPR